MTQQCLLHSSWYNRNKMQLFHEVYNKICYFYLSSLDEFSWSTNLLCSKKIKTTQQQVFSYISANNWNRMQLVYEMYSNACYFCQCSQNNLKIKNFKFRLVGSSLFMDNNHNKFCCASQTYNWNKMQLSTRDSQQILS